MLFFPSSGIFFSLDGPHGPALISITAYVNATVAFPFTVSLGYFRTEHEQTTPLTIIIDSIQLKNELETLYLDHFVPTRNCMYNFLGKYRVCDLIHWHCPKWLIIFNDFCGGDARRRKKRELSFGRKIFVKRFTLFIYLVLWETIDILCAGSPLV